MRKEREVWEIVNRERRKKKRIRRVEGTFYEIVGGSGK